MTRRILLILLSAVSVFAMDPERGKQVLRDQNCLSCHTPHGSAHGKLLNEKAPNLCQDCHVTGRHPTAFYGSGQGWTVPGTGAPNASVSSRFISRGCLNCHNSIHGSNAPSNRGKFLIR